MRHLRRLLQLHQHNLQLRPLARRAQPTLLLGTTNLRMPTMSEQIIRSSLLLATSGIVCLL